jgi:hypothetical protein
VAKESYLISLPHHNQRILQKFAQQFVLAMSRENYYCAIVTSRGVDIPLKTSRCVRTSSYHDMLNNSALEVVLSLHHNTPEIDMKLHGMI